MSKRSIASLTDFDCFVFQLASKRTSGTANGRAIRRAAERKRRIEAKQLAKSQSSKA